MNERKGRTVLDVARLDRRARSKWASLLGRAGGHARALKLSDAERIESATKASHATKRYRLKMGP